MRAQCITGTELHGDRLVVQPRVRVAFEVGLGQHFIRQAAEVTTTLLERLCSTDVAHEGGHERAASVPLVGGGQAT